MSKEIFTDDQAVIEEYSPPTWYVYLTVYECDGNYHMGMCKNSYFTVLHKLKPKTRNACLKKYFI
jgi:hypothetical protein